MPRKARKGHAHLVRKGVRCVLLLRNSKVSQATVDRASASFGQRGTLTLTNLVACYALLAYNMNAYQLEAPAHPTEPALPL